MGGCPGCVYQGRWTVDRKNPLRGFSEFISEGTGAGIAGLPDVYSANMLDTDLGLTWNVMTPAERLASQVNTGNLVWIGSNVTAAAPSVLGPRPSLKVVVPPASAGSSASIGPQCV